MGGGGRKIHCDFCDISYPANAGARRTHNKGSRHRSLRAKFYEDLRRAPAGVFPHRSTQTELAINPLAAAYWVTKHCEMSAGASMLLRPHMSHQLLQSTAIPSSCSSRRPNSVDFHHIVGPENIIVYAGVSRFQSYKQDSAMEGHSRSTVITDQWNTRPPANFSVHDTPISALPRSLLLDGNPTDIRTDWLD